MIAIAVTGIVVAILVAATSTLRMGHLSPSPSPVRSVPIGPPFDPMVRPATIDYFPAAMSERQISIGPDAYAVEYGWDMRTIHDPVPIATTVSLQMWREGAAPWQRDGLQLGGAPVDAVNGHPAWWVEAQQSLRWEFRTGAWVQLNVGQTIVDADVHPAVPLPQPGLALAEQVARSVRFGSGDRVRLPWHLRGMPSGLVPLSVQVTRDPAYQPWTAELTLAESTRPGVVAVTVRSTALPGSAPTTGQPGTAGDLVISDDGHSLVATEHGVRHELVFVAPMAPQGGKLRPLFEGFDLLDDPSSWTDRPLDG
jgi:hypothetical protein